MNTIIIMKKKKVDKEEYFHVKNNSSSLTLHWEKIRRNIFILFEKTVWKSENIQIIWEMDIKMKKWRGILSNNNNSDVPHPRRYDLTVIIINILLPFIIFSDSSAPWPE